MKRNKKAFSLIEVLAVILILVILTSLVVSSTKAIRGKVNTSSCIKNLKALHQAVLLFAVDDERRMITILSGNTPSDFPTANEFKNEYDVSDASYKNSIISNYAGSNLKKLSCPLCDTGLGYALNSNIVGANNQAKDSSGNIIPFEDLKSSNILIYEIDNSNAFVSRHNGKSFSININGTINYDTVNPTDLQNKN